jgi:hypothetical protein
MDLEALSSAQQSAIRAVCKRGALVGGPERANEPLPLLRVRATCEEPQLVATFVAAASHGSVISYEHYRYDAARMTPELETADAAMFAALHIKAPSAGRPKGAAAMRPSAACPDEILAQADSQTGMCLEAAVLGDAAAEDCGGKLRGRGWRRDDLSTSLIAKQTGKTIVCYHAPGKD